MSSTATTSAAQSQAVTLRGSAQLVKEFFHYGVNSILYQRGIYPAESFTRKQEYGLTLLVSTNDKVCHFLDSVLTQIEEWLTQRTVQRLVLVLANIDTKEVLERWEFKVEYELEQADPEDKENRGNQPQAKVYRDLSNKDQKKIRQEIQDVIRQITASVTFLPLLDCLCSFDILIYTNKDLDVPEEWGESHAHLIHNSEQVQLRSFSTHIHRVEAAVSYKADL